MNAKEAVTIQSLSGLLSMAIEAETAKEVTITFNSSIFKKLATYIYDGSYMEANLFELFKNAKIEMIKG